MTKTANNKILLEEIKKILLYKDRADETIISLYELSKLIKKKNLTFKKMMSRNFKTTVNNNCNNLKFYIHSINFNNEEIIFILEYNDQYKISCKKEDEKIKISPLTTIPNFIISKFNTEEIKKVYNNTMKYKDYANEEHYRIPLSNSSFLINITHQGISIYSEHNHKKDFILSSYTFKENYILQTDTYFIQKLITNNEELILKNTFIKIENCPTWAKNKLYTIRQKQIASTNIPKVKKIKTKPKNGHKF